MAEPVFSSTMRVEGYYPATSAVYDFQGPPTGKLPDEAGSVIHEDLGKQLIAGMETTARATALSIILVFLEMTAK